MAGKSTLRSMSGDGELSELVSKTELLRLMECPVCQEIPFPPIYQCVKGHNICKHCKPKLEECPMCRGKWSDVRNYTVEDIVRASKHVCPYKNDGCQTEETGDKMEEHINACNFRPFMCPRNGWDDCKSSTLRFSEAKEHFIAVHGATLLTGPSHTVSSSLGFEHYDGNRLMIANLRWTYDLIEFDGHHFLTPQYILKEKICWAVLYVGSSEEARKYRAKIICQPGQETEIQWTIPVKSISEGIRQRSVTQHNEMFVPSCSLSDFKHIAIRDEVNREYGFDTKFEILK